MGNHILVDAQQIKPADLLNINIQALTSSCNVDQQPSAPLMFRVWRLSDTKHGVSEQLVDFVSDGISSFGFDRYSAYICLTILDTESKIDPSEKLPFLAKTYVGSATNLTQKLDSHCFRRKCGRFLSDVTLLQGKRITSSTLLKSLSLYSKLEAKFRNVNDKFLRALFGGVRLCNQKIVKKHLKTVPVLKLGCPVQELLGQNQRVRLLPLLKELFQPQPQSNFSSLPIDKGINYWNLFSSKSPTKQQQFFQLDITGIQPHDPLNLSDFDHQLEMGMKEDIQIMHQNKMGDMSLSLLGHFKPILKFLLPETQPCRLQVMNQKKFYLLCRQKSNGVDIVMWEGIEWDTDQEVQGEFMQKVISMHFGHWAADKIYLHRRGYTLD